MSLPCSFTMRTVRGDVEVPSVGYGTITETTDGFPHLISQAIASGVRHLDCAWEYGVNREIAEGVRLSGVPRHDLFITHKINPHFYQPEHIHLCMAQILREMQTDYIDLLLLHLPVALKPLPGIEDARADLGTTLEQRRIEVTADNLWVIDAVHSARDIASANGTHGSIVPTWRAMEELVRQGKARAIGVSNFEIPHLQEILEAFPDGIDAIPISANQIEIHPYAPNLELRQFMREHDILAIAHSPFATFKWRFDPLTGEWPTDPLIPRTQPYRLLAHPQISKIARKTGMGPGQLINSWVVQSGAIPLGRSTNKARIQQNLDVRRLEVDDVDAIDALECPGLEGKGLLLADVFPGIQFPRPSE